jgi:hypothetical protein
MFLISGEFDLFQDQLRHYKSCNGGSQALYCLLALVPIKAVLALSSLAIKTTHEGPHGGDRWRGCRVAGRRPGLMLQAEIGPNASPPPCANAAGARAAESGTPRRRSARSADLSPKLPWRALPNTAQPCRRSGVWVGADFCLQHEAPIHAPERPATKVLALPRPQAIARLTAVAGSEAPGRTFCRPKPPNSPGEPCPTPRSHAGGPGCGWGPISACSMRPPSMPRNARPRMCWHCRNPRPSHG